MEVIDNVNRFLGDDLKRSITPNSKIAIAAASFSIYAFEALKRELEDIDSLQFIFTTPTGTDIEVYSKLPKSFSIPTPVGSYSPDWAIAFKQGTVKHIYFIAETKGSMSSMELREIEKSKIECARKFFTKITSDQVKYDVVTSYSKLMELVQ